MSTINDFIAQLNGFNPMDPTTAQILQKYQQGGIPGQNTFGVTNSVTPAVGGTALPDMPPPIPQDTPPIPPTTDTNIQNAPLSNQQSGGTSASLAKMQQDAMFGTSTPPATSSTPSATPPPAIPPAPPVPMTSSPATPTDPAAMNYWQSIFDNNGNNVPTQSSTGNNPEGQIGAGIHNAIAPIIENPYIKGILGAVGNAFQTSPLANDFNQLTGVAGAITGTPDLFGPNPLNPSTPGAGSQTGGGNPSPFDDNINKLTSRLQQISAMSQGGPANTAKFAPMVKYITEQLKDQMALRTEWRANQSAIGNAAAGSDAAKDIISTGETSERLHEKLDYLNKAIATGDPLQLYQAINSITEDQALLEGFKRVPGGLEAVNTAENAASGGAMDGFLDATHSVLVPQKIEGNLKGIFNISKILDNNYDTLMRQQQVYNSTIGKGNLGTAQQYNKYYQTSGPLSMEALTTNFNNTMKNTNFGGSGALATRTVSQAENSGEMTGKVQAATKGGQFKGYITEGADMLGLSPQQYSDNVPPSVQQNLTIARQKVQSGATDAKGAQAYINQQKQIYGKLVQNGE